MIVTGALGVAILIGLSVWQVQRLEWKEGVIVQLEARLAEPPMALPMSFDPETQEFSRVRLEGRFLGEAGTHGFADAPLLTSRKFVGPGYRIIQPFDLSDGRRVMVDRGFAPVEVKNEGGAALRPTPAPESVVEIIGALRWPLESADQPFGARDNVWTSRDLDAMARVFGAEKVLVVAGNVNRCRRLAPGRSDPGGECAEQSSRIRHHLGRAGGRVGGDDRFSDLPSGSQLKILRRIHVIEASDQGDAGVFPIHGSCPLAHVLWTSEHPETRMAATGAFWRRPARNRHPQQGRRQSRSAPAP